MFKRIPLNFLVSWASLRSNFQQEPLSPRSKTTEQLLRDISILQDRVSSVVPFASDLTSLTSLKENERCHLLIRWTLDLFHSIRHFLEGSSCIAFLGQAVFSSILCMSTITRVYAQTDSHRNKLTKCWHFSPSLLFVSCNAGGLLDRQPEEDLLNEIPECALQQWRARQS